MADAQPRPPNSSATDVTQKAVTTTTRSRRKPIRVAVLYNNDWEDQTPDDDPGYAARADVEFVASDIARELGENGEHEAILVPVDGDLARLRAQLLEIEPDCAFNMCE